MPEDHPERPQQAGAMGWQGLYAGQQRKVQSSAPAEEQAHALHTDSFAEKSLGSWWTPG